VCLPVLIERYLLFPNPKLEELLSPRCWGSRPGFALISAGERAFLGPGIDTAYLHVNLQVIKIRIWPFKFNTLLSAFISAFLKAVSKNNKLQTWRGHLTFYCLGWSRRNIAGSALSDLTSLSHLGFAPAPQPLLATVWTALWSRATWCWEDDFHHTVPCVSDQEN